MAQDSIRQMALNARKAGLLLNALSNDRRNQALLAMGESIERNLPQIIAANKRDLQNVT